MKLSKIITELQKTLSFDEIVAAHLNKIKHEEVISLPNSIKYEAVWTLEDGSKLYVEDEFFHNLS